MVMGTVTAARTGKKSQRVYVQLKNKSVWASPKEFNAEEIKAFKIALSASNMKLQLKDWIKVR